MKNDKILYESERLIQLKTLTNMEKLIQENVNEVVEKVESYRFV